jgi:hypothetical protein
MTGTGNRTRQVAISQQIGDAGDEELLRNAEASPGQHILEAVSSFRDGALAGPPGRSEVFRYQRLDLIVRDRRHPGVSRPGPPVTVWTISGSAPPGSSMS